MSRIEFHISDVWYLIIDYWHYAIFFIGAVMGSVLWVWNQYIKRFAERIDMEAYAEINTNQHDDIKNQLNALRKDMNDKHNEVLHTIINLHSEHR